MPRSAFAAEICDEVVSIKVEFGYPNEGTAFGHFVLRECLSKVLEYDDVVAEPDLDGFVNQSVTDGKDDNGIDAVIIGKNGKEINLFQFKYSDWNQYDKAEFLKTMGFLDSLVFNKEIEKGNTRYNSRLLEVLETKIKPALENGGRITFHYVGAYFEPDLISVIENLKQKYQQPQSEIDFRTYDYEQLSILLHNTFVPKNSVTLVFPKGEFFLKGGAFHLEESQDTKVRSWVGSICAQSLKDALDRHGYSLFDLNVRYFKGFTGDVNRSIKREYEKGPKSNFWFLNNGINAICRKFEVEEDQLQIDSLQIVNGCQTSKALQEVINVDSSISVLFRLTEIKDAIAIHDISDLIAVASNKQNPISNRDLHANDSIQREIAAFLERKGIFYDCKEGSWKEADKRKYKIDKHKWNKIKNVDLAVSYMSLFLQTPVLSKGREKIAFSDDADYYGSIFDRSNGPENLVKRLMLAYRLRELVDSLKIKYAVKYPEFLTASYATDITLALLAISLLKLEKIELQSSLDKMRDKIQGLKPEFFIDENFSLLNTEILEKAFDSVANKVNNYLEALKDSTMQTEEPFNTTNWLKNQDNYSKLFEKVVPWIRGPTL